MKKMDILASLFAFFVFAIFVGVLSLMVRADEDSSVSEKEKALLQKIEELEKRVKELEDIVKQSGARVENIEKGGSSQSTVEVEVSEDKGSKGSYESKKSEAVGKGEVPLKAFWKDRLTFGSEDKSFELQVGGRLQLDWAFFDNDVNLERVFGEEEDGIQFRRARIDFSGRVHEDILYRVEFDFAGDKDLSGRGKFTDVHLTFSDLPFVGNLQVGHFREPFGLERLTSNNFITFMERGLNDVFNPKRNVGIMMFNSAVNSRLIWQAGLFKETDDFPSDDDTDEDQGYSFTGRIVFLPWYKKEGNKLLHLGLAYSHRNPNGASFRYRAQPDSALANYYVDTDKYQGFRLGEDAVVDDLDLVGSELLFIYGPFSIQAEYASSFVDTLLAGNERFSGGYLYASYFLTGETRAYNLNTGTLTRVIVKESFDPKRGKWGAWELGLRYSWIDLDSKVIRGGEEATWTLGLNWYLNPNTRLMLNYSRADVEHDLYEGTLNILQTRLQIDF